MKNIAYLAFLCFCLFLFEEAIALRCRAGNQQADDQFQKILQTCRKRYSGNDSDNDSSSNDNNDSDDSSNEDEDIFDKRFFMNNNRYSNTQSSRNQNNGNRRSNQSNQRDRNSQSSQSSQSSSNYRSNGNSRSNNNRDDRTSIYQSKIKNNGMNFNDSGNYNKEREQACAIQCFFNELNVVDHRGFPDKDAIIYLMVQNIHDPELRDFVEESIIECFHYLNSDVRKEKCEFSQNLLSCMADKGRERCEDWNN